MAEQTFKSPNFYEREIDLSAPVSIGPIGVPAGIIGTANKGPAFVPVTVANFDEYVEVFGNLDPQRPGPYAANEFLKHRSALTFLRILGAGANTTTGHIESTLQTGRVQGAGFRLAGVAAPNDTQGRHAGCVQFIVAGHTLQAAESYGMPMFTDNASYEGSTVNLIRGVVLVTTSSRVMVLDGNESAVGAFSATTPDDGAALVSGKFKLVISSSLGNTFSNTDLNAGIKVFTASFDPTADDYFAKVMNRDPDRFIADQHMLYADFAVDDEVATATTVGVLSGSSLTDPVSGDTSMTFREAFGSLDTRYTTPKSTWFISQPFGATEYDLFYFEARDDGEYANTLYKVSIANVKASLDDSKPYGTFTVQIRSWDDTDANPKILEQYPNCSLDPNADNYVAKLIGDRRVTYNFDSTLDDDRRIVTSGRYPNISKLVRVVVSSDVETAVVPAKSLPFGFRGIETLKTNDNLTDRDSTWTRLGMIATAHEQTALSSSIVPPTPFRYKITKGTIPSTAQWPGQPGPLELASSQLYWGVKFERNTDPDDANLSSEKNALLESLTKFIGIKKLDVLVTGSGADTFNNNKFTLSNVVLANGSISHLTASVKDHMREAAYVRNAKPDKSSYTITDAVLGNRITLATILSQDTAANFNRFSTYAKFTNFLYGGWDGVNILDRNARRMNDKATSFDEGGGAESTYVGPGMATNPAGAGQSNSTVTSYLTAIKIMTDPQSINTNILVIPGIKESFITDTAAKSVRDYGLAYYIMDIPSYDDNNTRLYDDSVAGVNVDKTAAALDSRAIDNSYVGTYFPDVFITDTVNNRKVEVPSSIAALGALAFNDKVSYPWFAPAGFNRASLDFVSNVKVRLAVNDRDTLQESRINPIATFPRLGFVIYGQKTLQISKSALDRVNVRRLMLEVKRIVIDIARAMVFENNTPEVRNKFVADSTLQLALIQAQQGIESFQVIMNETNNTDEDIDLNRLNGKIVVVPTRAFEFISIDFIITNSGILFV